MLYRQIATHSLRLQLSIEWMPQWQPLFHRHLFWKRQFLPRSARVDVCPEMKLNFIYSLISFSKHMESSYFCPQICPQSPPHFYSPKPNLSHSYAPNAQTISICHASPPQLHSEYRKECTKPHYAFWAYINLTILRSVFQAMQIPNHYCPCLSPVFQCTLDTSSLQSFFLCDMMCSMGYQNGR